MPRVYKTLLEDMERFDKENGTRYAEKMRQIDRAVRPIYIGLGIALFLIFIKAIFVNI